jgi:hypothetical protein
VVKARLEDLEKDFYSLRDSKIGEKHVLDKIGDFEKDTESYLAPWNAFSRENGDVYPSQGLLLTPHDYLEVSRVQRLPEETLLQTLRLRFFFLELFNHPYRTHFLNETTNSKFQPPKKISCKAIDAAHASGLSLSIGDLGASVDEGMKKRIGRTQRYAQGPFVKLGRQARTLFSGSASPDVWNSAAALATMAASHCIASLPRNGVTSNLKRQADLAKETFSWLTKMEKTTLAGHPQADMVARHWRNNILGTVEASPVKALERAKVLQKAGVNAFRVYSPEPNADTIETVRVLRKEFGDEIEIFAGQTVSVKQAVAIEKAGADGLYVGIGGGGRCITGVRSGSVIDWPGLLWQLRGEIGIPVIAEGGASDHVAVSLLLGASGISVSRVVAGGTIESPGGALFCVDEAGKFFKPYGGEASARTKYLDGKLLPFNVPAFVEGETAQAQISYVPYVLPTLTYNLHLLIEDSILALVFRNVRSLHELQSIDPSPLRQATGFDSFQRNVH